jgi:hypothetical protein
MIYRLAMSGVLHDQKTGVNEITSSEIDMIQYLRKSR